MNFVLVFFCRGSRTTRKLSSLAIYSEDNDDISDLTTGLENTSEYGECSSSSVSDKETMDNVSESHTINCKCILIQFIWFLCLCLQSDNNSDVDKPKDVQDKKKTEDVFNNNNNNNSHNNLHSTALIKDVIHKKPVIMQSQEVVVKTEISDVMTAKVASSIYTMSTSTTSTKSSTKTISNDYTYDDAIEDYKSRVSRASNPVQQPFSTNSMVAKLDVPKVDLWKRRELFEIQSDSSTSINNSGNTKLSGEITSIKDRISSLKSNLVTQTAPMAPRKVELATTTKLKDRLSSLQSSVNVEEQKRPIEIQFRNVQEVKNEFEQQQQQQQNVMKAPAGLMLADDTESLDTDREDSGIHTTDVSCSVSQADQFDEQQIDEFQIVEERVLKLNAAAAAKVSSVKECNIVQPMAAQIYLAEESIDMDQIDDESSVSYSESDGQESIVEGNNEHTNNNINNISNGNGNDNGTKVNVEMNSNEEYENVAPPELTKNPPPSPGVSTSIFEFIHCNLLKSNTNDNLMIIDELNSYDCDTDLDNNYVYECIKINKRNGNDQHLKCNGLEKSNSIDTALSLCSSSEMESFMEYNDTEKMSIVR